MYYHSAMKNKKDSQKSRENTISFYSKLSNKEKELFRESANLILPEKKALTFDDLIKFEKAKESLLPLKEKYKVSLDELFTFVKAQLFLPVTIFKNKLTVLESSVKYLKEEENLSLHKIAGILGRDQRNIWHIYNKASKKYPENFVISPVKLWIPVSIFSDTKLSALEAIVSYLKEELSLIYHEIALLLKRDDRTIWTVYQRANKKNVKST